MPKSRNRSRDIRKRAAKKRANKIRQETRRQEVYLESMELMKIAEQLKNCDGNKPTYIGGALMGGEVK